MSDDVAMNRMATPGRSTRTFRVSIATVPLSSQEQGVVEIDYSKDAIEILNSRRRPARPTTTSYSVPTGSTKLPNGQSDVRGTPSIVGMKQWLELLGHSASAIEMLNIIHVAGTKGKGSTCAFIDSFLASHASRTGFPRKRGLYTSPHIMTPEERIRIDMRPIDRALFTKYFFEVHDALLSPEDDKVPLKPRYLQLFFLLAIHTFIREGVEAAVIETHHGGEFDATNVLERPIVTAITSLGYDHISQLGPTIENIAWHKSGIFKKGAVAFSVVDGPSVTKVLKDRAAEKGAELTFVDINPDLPKDEISVHPDVQKLNCSLALAVTQSWIQRIDPQSASLSTEDMIRGVRRFSWPGRFQVHRTDAVTWYLDAAHNSMSVPVAAKWFIESSPRPRALIFGHVSQQREPEDVMRSIAAAFKNNEIDVAVLTTYDAQQDFEAPEARQRPGLLESDRTELETLASIWKKRHPDTPVLVADNVAEAVAIIKSKSTIDVEKGSIHALITGSQHLVGAALFALKEQQ